MGHRILMPIFQGSLRRSLFRVPLREFTENLLYVQQITPCNYAARHYAKDKNRGGGKKSAKIEISKSEISQLVDYDKLKAQLEKAVERMKDEYIQNLTLRSTTGAIETVNVKHEGKEYKLQEISQIVRKNPKTVILHFPTFPQMIPSVLKALSTSGMNLSPQQDGTSLFVPVPKITKEHRENSAKNAKALYHKCRNTLNEIQIDYLKKAKNQEGFSEDVVWRVSKQIEMVTGLSYLEAKSLLDMKLKELIG